MCGQHELSPSIPHVPSKEPPGTTQPWPLVCYPVFSGCWNSFPYHSLLSPKLTSRCLENLSRTNPKVVVIFLKTRKQHLSGRDAVLTPAASQPGSVHLRAWVRDTVVDSATVLLLHFLGEHSQARVSEAAGSQNIISLSL